MSFSQNAMAAPAPAAKAADVVASKQQDVNACLAKARNQLDQKDFEGARSTCEAALQRHPHDSNLRFLLGEYHYNQGKISHRREKSRVLCDATIEAYKAAIHHGYVNADVYYNLAEAYGQLYLYVEASPSYRIEAFKNYMKARALNPKYPIRQVDLQDSVQQGLRAPTEEFLELLLQFELPFGTCFTYASDRQFLLKKISSLQNAELKFKILIALKTPGTLFSKIYESYGQEDFVLSFIKEEAVNYTKAGKVFKDKGELPSAIDNYKKASQLFTDANQREKAYCYVQAGEFRLAILTYQKLHELGAIDHNELAVAYDAIGERDNALMHYGIAINLDPRHGMIYANRGELYHAMHKLKEAIDDYTQAARCAPSENYFYILGKLYLENNEFLKALENFQRGGQNAYECCKSAFIEAFKKPSKELFNYLLGFGLNSRGLLVDVAQAVKEELNKDNILNYIKNLDDTDLQERILVAAQNEGTLLGKFFASHKVKLAELVEEKVKFYAEQGQAEYKRDLNRALDWTNKIIRLKPNAETYKKQGDLCRENNQIDFAINAYKSAIQLKPDFAEAYYNLGLAYVDLAEKNAGNEQIREMAIENLQKAAELKPNHFALVHYHLGLLYFKKNNFISAASNFQHAVEAMPELKLEPDKQIKAYKFLGEIYENHFRVYDGAVKYYTEALNLQPADDEAKAMRRRALLSGIQAPSPDFLDLLLQQNNREMFADIENEKINKDKLFAEINKLADIKLKQNLLCQMLLKDTFLGKLFLNYDLKKICKALESTVSDAKRTLELRDETREMLRKDEKLRATLLGSPEFYKTYKIIFTWTLGLGIRAPSTADAKVLPPAGARVYPVLAKNEDDWVIDACTQRIEKNKDAKEGLDDAKAYADRGAAYCRKGDYACAYADINHAIKLNPILGIAFFHLGDMYRCQKQLDLAIQNYSNAIRLNPELAEARCHLGHVLCEQGSFDLAIINYRKAMSLNSCFDREIIQNLTEVINSGRGTAEIYHLRGDCYQRARRFDLAIQDYAHAKVNNERKAALLLALKEPSKEFLELLLLPAYGDMFSDIASEAIDKDKVFAAINKLQDKQLKQNLLCQILLKETFLGKLFHKKRFFERDFSAKAADALVVFVDDAKEGLNLDRGTIQALVKELPMTSPALQKICKYVASKCLAEGHKHIQENNFELAFEDYHHATKLDSALVTAVQYHCKNAFLVAQENPSEAFFKLLLKPYVWKMLVDLNIQHEVNKDKLPQAIKELKDKDLKQAVLRQALLPRTFFNNIFANDHAEIAELFIAEVGLERALADDAIRAVFLTGGLQTTLIQQSSTYVDNVPIAKPENFQKLFLLAALNNNPKMFFNLMLRPIYRDSLTSRDINKDQLLQVLKVLSDKDLQLRVLWHALLPGTFFGRIFAEQREEIANLFVAKIHIESTLSDAEIKAVMSENLQDKLAQQNRALYVKQQSAWGLTRLEGQLEQPASLAASSARRAYQAFGVSPGAVVHEGEPEIKPGCDGSRFAVVCKTVQASYEDAGRRPLARLMPSSC